MARTRNAVKTVWIKISTTPQVHDVLTRLAQTGRFGKSATEVAEELLRAKMREVELEGWLGQIPFKPGRSNSGRARVT
jgi:hypothetical protein